MIDIIKPLIEEEKINVNIKTERTDDWVVWVEIYLVIVLVNDYYF